MFYYDIVIFGLHAKFNNNRTDKVSHRKIMTILLFAMTIFFALIQLACGRGKEVFVRQIEMKISGVKMEQELDSFTHFIILLWIMM